MLQFYKTTYNFKTKKKKNEKRRHGFGDRLWVERPATFQLNRLKKSRLSWNSKRAPISTYF